MVLKVYRRCRPRFNAMDRLEAKGDGQDTQQMRQAEAAKALLDTISPEVGASVGANAPPPNEAGNEKAAKSLPIRGFPSSRGGTRTLDPGIMSAVL